MTYQPRMTGKNAEGKPGCRPRVRSEGERLLPPAPRLEFAVKQLGYTLRRPLAAPRTSESRYGWWGPPTRG
jgi:hypothetical protein